VKFPNHSVESVLLRNGTLIDCTGAPPIPGSLLIRGQRIAEVGIFPAPAPFEGVGTALPCCRAAWRHLHQPHP
jgi:hypothetical protein